jgi:thioredoxin-related protein
MHKLLLAASAWGAMAALAIAASEYETDFGQALEKAKSEQKMMFVFYGRQSCGICQATKAMIKSHDIRLSPSKYVMLDLNCDDPKTSAEFNKRYKGEKFGKTLPFVVVADSNGAPLASGSGYKDAREWDKILKAAQKKTATPAATAADKDANWPFKSAPASKP